MLKRLISAVLCALLISCLGPAAMAADFFTVTIQKGDTVYSLCQSYGVDYDTQKHVIMALNGMEREAQLNSLRAGESFKLPASGSAADYAAGLIQGDDQVEYYVIPYVIQKGDSLANVYWLWGLRFETYADAIRSLNGVDDLDLLYVGAIYLLPTTRENLQTDVYTTVMSHIMRPGETAYDVITGYGIDYNQNIPRLRSYNGGADLTRIPAGEKLLIPLG